MTSPAHTITLYDAIGGHPAARRDITGLISPAPTGILASPTRSSTARPGAWTRR